MSADRALAIAYLGNDRWSVPPLEAIAASRHDVRIVVTRTPRPGRRGGVDVPTPVALAARRLGLPLAEVETARSGEGLEVLTAAAPDILVVVAYGEILPHAVLSIPAIAPVNVHFSLLPALRGASPVRTALLHGLDETGVSTIAMDEGLDTGGILMQAAERIAPEDDAGSLGERLARLGGGLLVRTVERLAAGTIDPVPQDDARATYAAKLTASDRRIDWGRPAEQVVNRVRAFAPDPGATTTMRQAPLKILRARATGGSGIAGEVVAVDADGFVVAAGVGAVRVLDLAPAGRARMSASAFVNGFRPVVGERLS
jgi:methionyl-tRNA formyltransferase